MCNSLGLVGLGFGPSADPNACVVRGQSQACQPPPVTRRTPITRVRDPADRVCPAQERPRPLSVSCLPLPAARKKAVAFGVNLCSAVSKLGTVCQVARYVNYAFGMLASVVSRVLDVRRGTVQRLL
eukprot:12506224-Alexandrium_andersonii.AAC.1